MDLNLTQMYLTSPDWLKLLWAILPHMTTWILASILVFGGGKAARPSRPVDGGPERVEKPGPDA